MTEKNSGEPKRKATPATTGARNISTRIASELPTKELIVVTNRATPARPLRAMG